MASGVPLRLTLSTDAEARGGEEGRRPQSLHPQGGPGAPSLSRIPRPCSSFTVTVRPQTRLFSGGVG